MLRYLSIGALMLSGATAMAEGPSYSYIDASYQKIDADGGIDTDGDGYDVAGSVAINDNWFVFAGYSNFEFKSAGDLDQTTVGGGWNSAISEKTDWFATLAFADLGIRRAGFGSRSDSGLGVNVGIRSMVYPNFELYGSLGYADYSDRGGVTAVAAGLWYTVGGNLALGLGLDADSDFTSYGVGIRLYFDK